MLNAGIFEFLKDLIVANCGQSYILGNLRHEQKRMLMHEASVRGKTERKIYSFWKTKLIVRYLRVGRFLEMPYVINISFKIGIYITGHSWHWTIWRYSSNPFLCSFFKS